MQSTGNKKADETYTIVIGCGRLGADLANRFSDEDGDVLVIDKSKDAFRKLSPSFGGLTVVGDAMDFSVLKEAQIERAHLIVAVTDNDNANIFVAQLARQTFQVPRVIIRLYDPERECVYHTLGIDTICPAILSANAIYKILSEKDGQPS
ncbi:Trk system potassium uptake protein TrkA [bioreactor metagenome]|uniref:Trk system potassium uptake protein TrkA n=1 Tax=bioreactor metagenome TaxID=1076179 RepID=A0A645BLC3_9ZZZZ